MQQQVQFGTTCNLTSWTWSGRPLFIPDVTSGGVGRMFGMELVNRRQVLRWKAVILVMQTLVML